MFGNDADTNSSPSQNNAESYREYLNRALRACEEGDAVLSMHLYLAAYERSIQELHTADPAVIEGMRHAWALACQEKERSLAEYIFEKLEPYLSHDETTQCAAQLQQLALDKLEEFGLSREDLEDMTDMISQDFFGMDATSLFMHMDGSAAAPRIAGITKKGLVRPKDNSDVLDVSALMSSVSKQLGATEEAASSKDAASTSEDKTDSEPKNNRKAAEKNDAVPAPDEKGQKAHAKSSSQKSSKAEAQTHTALALPNIATLGEKKNEEASCYKDLIGFKSAIESMRGFGIGVQGDPEYKELVKTLSARHGINRMAVTDTFLFRAAVREDANQFMIATMGELNLPMIRMRMEENLQGFPILCVMTTSEHQPRLNMVNNIFENGGVLVLEDIDLWGPPLNDFQPEEMSGFFMAHLSRGAREAINFIRSAVENPDVYVLVSSALETEIDDLFFDLLEPLTIIDIDLPDIDERTELWKSIAEEHPSVHAIERDLLVKYSSKMSRFDIYMAAREAVEEAYKASLIARKYVAVTKENMFEKIALYQPLESAEYEQLENEVIDSFKAELDKIDDLMQGFGEDQNGHNPTQ